MRYVDSPYPEKREGKNLLPDPMHLGELSLVLFSITEPHREPPNQLAPCRIPLFILVERLCYSPRKNTPFTQRNHQGFRGQTATMDAFVRERGRPGMVGVTQATRSRQKGLAGAQARLLAWGAKHHRKKPRRSRSRSRFRSRSGIYRNLCQSLYN